MGLDYEIHYSMTKENLDLGSLSCMPDVAPYANPTLPEDIERCVLYWVPATTMDAFSNTVSPYVTLRWPCVTSENIFLCVPSWVIELIEFRE